MVFMENGKMDSNSEVVDSQDSRFIMDHGNKSIRTYRGDEDKPSVTFQDNDTVTRENKFSNCNGNAINGDEVSNLTNGAKMCNICDENSYSSNPKGSNSSQCGISSVQKTISSSLESSLSNLSIRTDHEEVSPKLVESNHINCNSSSRNNDCTVESIQDSRPSNQNEPKTNICAANPSLVQEDVHSSHHREKEKDDDDASEVVYICYESEKQMPDIMKLIQKDLSEPYSIYTYRYFIHNWPHLCFLAISKGTSVGAIVCKLDIHRKVIKRGYIAMLAVDESYRKHGIGSNLVLNAIRVMAAEGADEVVLETEITNQPALRLYENLGFVRDKRLFRYYLNGEDALRLKLWLR